MRVALLAIGLLVLLGGCREQYDPRVNVRNNVGSDTAGVNIITKPIGGIVSWIIGQGIKIDGIKEVRTPEGFLQVQVSGYNESAFTKYFEYKPEWLDANGMVIDTVMSKWMPVSVLSGSRFSFVVTAPSPKAMDYRINTRETKNVDKTN
jgi:hypothetical protein